MKRKFHTKISKKIYKFNFIHVVTKGIKDEFIFYKESYKNEHISLLNKYETKIKYLKVLEYCILDNHANILIYTE